MPDRHATATRVVFGVLAVASAALLAWFLLWSESPQARYARMSCQYRAIYGAQGPVGGVILGTSRAQHGIDPAQLRQLLGPGTAPIVSLARGGRGPGQLRQMLVDLDEERGIRGPIIFEYSPEDIAFWRDEPLYYQYMPNEGQRLRFAALADDWSGKPREPAYSRARDLLAHVELRIDAGIESLLTGSWRRNADVPMSERPSARTVWCRTDKGITSNAGQERQMNRRERAVRRQVGDTARWRDQRPDPESAFTVNQDLQNAVVADVIALGRERGIPVLFVLMPEYLSAPYAPAFLREFERRFGVPLTVPPPDMVERFGDRGLYLDVFHLNRDGGAVYTDWLAERIRADGG
jgi:hypothetical protein